MNKRVKHICTRFISESWHVLSFHDRVALYVHGFGDGDYRAAIMSLVEAKMRGHFALQIATIRTAESFDPEKDQKLEKLSPRLSAFYRTQLELASFSPCPDRLLPLLEKLDIGREDLRCPFWG